MRGYFYTSAINVVLPWFVIAVVSVASSILSSVIVATLFGDSRIIGFTDNGFFLNLITSSVNDNLIFNFWVAIKIGICKILSGRACIVDDVKPQFSVVFSQSCSSPYDLLELAHRVHDTSKHHVFTGRCIYTCG